MNPHDKAKLKKMAGIPLTEGEQVALDNPYFYIGAIYLPDPDNEVVTTATSISRQAHIDLNCPPGISLTSDILFEPMDEVIERTTDSDNSTNALKLVDKWVSICANQARDFDQPLISDVQQAAQQMKKYINQNSQYIFVGAIYSFETEISIFISIEYFKAR